jgi:hypothetical protein
MATLKPMMQAHYARYCHFCRVSTGQLYVFEGLRRAGGWFMICHYCAGDLAAAWKILTGPWNGTPGDSESPETPNSGA